MAATLQIDKMLETVVRERASDLHITTGQPPVLRLGGHLVRLETKTLTPEDTVGLMKSICPERNQQELQEVFPSGHHEREAKTDAPLRLSPARLITCGHGGSQGLTTLWHANGLRAASGRFPPTGADGGSRLPFLWQRARDRLKAGAGAAALPVRRRLMPLARMGS